MFLELLTYRIVGHSRSDPGAYRKPGELDEWKQRDPLLLARQALVKNHGVSESDIDRVDAEVEDQMTAIVTNALAAPWPDPALPVDQFAGATQ